MKIVKKIAPVFEEYIFNWDYETYLGLGGYGSGKSYQTALKIIFKCLEEKRKVLVIRDVYETIQESCYDLFVEILSEMNLFTDDPYEFKRRQNRVLGLKSPFRFRFPGGSQIIFKGMDKPSKVKSINGVSIVWLEEASEIKYDGYKELLGRLRTPNVSMHYILTTNPVGKENWIYKHFFRRTDEQGKETIILDESRLYEKKTIVKKGTYYHHSTLDDNPWLPWQYVKRINELRYYDYPLYKVARWGQFGATGTRVLPNFMIAPNQPERFRKQIAKLGPEAHYFGFDFGFEESFNAVISMAVDVEKQILYIYDEIYINKITDDKFALHPKMLKLKDKVNSLNSQGYRKFIVADNEDPKAIAYYQNVGFKIRGCKNKFKGSRLSNTRKMKRFKKIIVSPKCENTIRELKDLTYKKKQNGELIYDDFNIDPHTFSAIWYALDKVNIMDLKKREFNSRHG